MMTKDAATIDDLADSITALGTMFGEQLTGFKNELKQEIQAVEKRLTGQISGLQTETSGLKSEMAGIQSEMTELRREQRAANERLTSLENESKAVRNDLKEIYGLLVKVEKRLDKIDKRLERVPPAACQPIRREVDDIKAWARKASAKAGLPATKF